MPDQRVDRVRLAARDIEDLAGGCGRRAGGEVRRDDVVDIGEVPRLLTVAVHDRPLVQEGGSEEVRDDGRILRDRTLPRAEHVEVAKRHGLQPVHLVEARAVRLPGKLGDAVGRQRGDGHVLRLDLSRRRRTVDRRRGRVDDPSHACVARRKQHVERAGDVDLARAQRILDRARHGRQRGLVEDDLASLDGREHPLEAPQIAFDDLDVLRDVKKVSAIAGREVVEDTHVVAAGEERVDEMRADEAGTTGDENAGHQAANSQTGSMSTGMPPPARDSSIASMTWMTSTPIRADERGSIPVRIAWQKSAQLQRERLGCLHTRREDVARAVAQTVFAEGLRIGDVDARVEETHRLGARVVVHHHALGPDDGRAAEFARREPGELHVRDGASGICEMDKGDVRRVRDDAPAARRRDTSRVATEPVAQDRNVVRAEIPDDADVGLVQAEVHTACRHEVDLAEVTLRDQLAHLVHRWAVQERVTRHEDQSALRRQLGKPLPVVGRTGERLLDERMLARKQCRLGQLTVCRDRCRDHDRVDRLVLEDGRVVGRRGDIRMAARDRLDQLGPEIAHRDELGFLELAQVAHEVRPPVSEADDGDTNRLVRKDRRPPGHAAEPVSVGRTHRVARLPSSCIGVRSKSLRSSPNDQLRAYATSISSASPKVE